MVSLLCFHIIFPLCFSMSKFPLFIRTELYWTGTHSNNLILTYSSAKKVHLQVLGIRTSTSLGQQNSTRTSASVTIQHFLQSSRYSLAIPAEVCVRRRELRIVAIASVKGQGSGTQNFFASLFSGECWRQYYFSR